MNVYDSGQHRKPPLPYNTSGNTEYLDELSTSQQEATNEVVIVCIIASPNETIMSQIGCIILSSDLREKESFSFNFTVHAPFDTQSDYIYGTLNNRIWIISDIYNSNNIQLIIDNSFKSINKITPQAQNIINASQTFNYQYTNYTNARIGVNHIYSTLQRIALNQLLSPLTAINFTNNAIPTQQMQSVIAETNDYNQPTIQEQNINNNDSNNNEYINNTNINPTSNNDILNEIMQPTITDTTINNMNNNNNNNNEPSIYEIDNNNETSKQEQQQQTQAQTPPIINNNERNGFHEQEINNNNNNINSEQAQQELEDEKIEQIEKIEYEQQTDNNSIIEDQVIEQVEQEESVNNDNINNIQNKQEQNIINNINNMNNMNNMHEQTQQITDSRSISPINNMNMNNINNINNIEQQAKVSNSNSKMNWADKFKKVNKQQISPKKSSLNVVNRGGISRGMANRGGKYKSFADIRNSIADAIDKKRIIWVSYNGHQKPFIPRAIRPITWDTRAKQKEASFFAIQHKSKSQNQQRFYLKNVWEVRNQQWRISNDELQQLKKRNNTYNNYNNTQTFNNNNQTNAHAHDNNNYNRQRYKNQRPRQYNTNNQQNIDK